MAPVPAPSMAAVLLLLTLTATLPVSLAVTDVDILNFALNLEYLEATFYSYAAWGVGLSEADRGGGPSPLPMAKGELALLSPAARQYAADIASDEIAHVRYLRAALGELAVPAPVIDVKASFAAAANAAFGQNLTVPFSPYLSDLAFYIGAFVFEDVGVTAYKGALPLISNKAYVEVAAGILATEAYHGGAIRSLLWQSNSEVVFPYMANARTIVGAISALRAGASGAMDDKGLQENGFFVIAPGDMDSIAFSRSTQQVLNIVYLGSEPGGFFPMGLNGAIK